MLLPKMHVERDLIPTLASVASYDPPRNRTAGHRVLKKGEGVKDDFIEFLLLPAPASIGRPVGAAVERRAGPVHRAALPGGVPGSSDVGVPGAVRGPRRPAVH